MSEILKSKLLSSFAEIEHGTYRGPRAPYFSRDSETGKIAIDEIGLLENMKLPDGHTLVIGEQEHTDNIFIVRDVFDKALKIQNTDGLITNLKNIHLLVYTADCLPILIYDPVKKVVAAVHSGWKGVVAKIAVKTIEKMETEFGSDRKDVIVYVGPSIGPCCYADKIPERFEKFKKYKNGCYEKEGMYHLNLWGAVEEDLLKFGVQGENIEVSNICTAENNDKFASHYVEGDKRTTTNMSMISLK